MSDLKSPQLLERLYAALPLGLGEHDGVSDQELLRAFLAGAREGAFAELVRRHGPMVLGVCLRTLRHRQDAEDACQATFLVLARKAHAVSRPEHLSSWLYRVALRAAGRLRTMRERRQRSTQTIDALQVPGPQNIAPDSDLAALFDEEMAKLPEHYRLPILMCELQGRSRRSVAEELGIPEGTLSSRLAKAKTLLAASLTRRGVQGSAAALTAFLVGQAVARVPAEFAGNTVQVAALGASASIQVDQIAEGVLKAMFVSKLKGVGVGVLFVAVGIGAWAAMPGGNAKPGNGGAAKRNQEIELGAAELVQKLASPAFADREAAAKALRQLGLKALPAIRAGIKDPDAEIAQRCTTLLASIRQDEWKSFVAAFQADKDGTRDFDHPVWLRFKKVVGGDKASRELFALMIADANHGKLLESTEYEPDKAGEQYGGEAVRIGRLAKDGIPALPETVKGPRGPYREYYSSVGEIATLMFVGTYSGTGKSLPNEAEIYMLLRSDFGYPVRAASTAKPPLRRLFAVWLDSRSDRDTIESALRVALDLNIREVLPTARRIAADTTERPIMLGLAVAILGKFGEASDIKTLTDLSRDNRRIICAPQIGKNLQLEVRDLAIAMRLLLLDQDPAKFGFPVLKEKPWRLIRDGAFELDWAGFWDEATRESTHKKALAWLESKK